MVFANGIKGHGDLGDLGDYAKPKAFMLQDSEFYF